MLTSLALYLAWTIAYAKVEGIVERHEAVTDLTAWAVHRDAAYQRIDTEEKTYLLGDPPQYFITEHPVRVQTTWPSTLRDALIRGRLFLGVPQRDGSRTDESSGEMRVEWISGSPLQDDRRDVGWPIPLHRYAVLTDSYDRDSRKVLSLRDEDARRYLRMVLMPVSGFPEGRALLDRFGLANQESRFWSPDSDLYGSPPPERWPVVVEMLGGTDIRFAEADSFRSDGRELAQLQSRAALSSNSGDFSFMGVAVDGMVAFAAAGWLLLLLAFLLQGPVAVLRKAEPETSAWVFVSPLDRFQEVVAVAISLAWALVPLVFAWCHFHVPPAALVLGKAGLLLSVAGYLTGSAAFVDVALVLRRIRAKAS